MAKVHPIPQPPRRGWTTRMARKARGRGNKSVEEIATYVQKGFPQSAVNCRVLLDEIERLRKIVETRNDDDIIAKIRDILS